MMFQAGDQEGAGKYVQEALDCNPTDDRLRGQLERIVGAANAPISSGSGFAIADGGLILTNNHVVEGPGSLWVRIVGEEKEVRASVVATDAKHDIALIKLDAMPKTALKPMLLSSKTPGPGTDIAVFGYPLGDVLGGGLKLTKGAISASPDKGRSGMYLLDCKVNHGNSGGPMCDKHGQVVGLVSAKTTVGAETDSYGMALPPDTMATFIKKNLPKFQTAPTGGKVFGEWDEVYGVVSPSVVMILKRAS
jgi:S1-C subfamily serine protease